MIDRLIRSTFAFAAGAAVGAAGAMWLMSDSGKETREELRKLASQAKDKIQQYCDQVKQEMEAEQPAPEA
ncbi:MAG: YtxH domain-containing protein [Paludibacteraceae bacterium]|nr:YtxH domain-containing protein [Paludibacteraceae bacterium]MBR6492347.1 YtxH domain-containing protein [Paludibacteraceae bacterium]